MPTGVTMLHVGMSDEAVAMVRLRVKLEEAERRWKNKNECND
jgi:hypothetical protein